MAESVYINIWGIGSKHTNSSEFDTYSYYNQISEVISYNRKNIISDYRILIGDAEKLEKEEYLTETSRLISMCNLIIFYLLTTIPKKEEIIDFDRILYKIGDFFRKDSTSKDYIISYLDEYNIRDINSFLNLLSDKDIFQLYFSFKPYKDKTPILASSKIEPVPDGIVIKEIKVDKKIKDNLNLLSIHQLNILCGNNVRISDIKTATDFITSYNKMIEEIKLFKKINYNDLLEYLRNYNRQICIEFLKTCSIQEIKENIKLLHDDIKISIYISLTLKNLSSLSS